MAERNQVIIVCTGNTCRSPMGERLLAHALAAEPAPLNQLEVISAGVAAFPGDLAARNSIKALAKVGLDLSDHRSRIVSPPMLDQAHAIFVMTEGHRRQVNALGVPPEVPVLLFRELMGETVDAADVPDPIGADLRAYAETRDALAEAIPSIVAFLRERLLPA